MTDALLGPALVTSGHLFTFSGLFFVTWTGKPENFPLLVLIWEVVRVGHWRGKEGRSFEALAEKHQRNPGIICLSFSPPCRQGNPGRLPPKETQELVSEGSPGPSQATESPDSGSFLQKHQGGLGFLSAQISCLGSGWCLPL